MSNGKIGDRPLSMICHIGHVWREKGLILIVNRNAGIGPPQKCLEEWSAVVDLYTGFDQSLVGVKSNPDHAFHAVHGFMLAKPDGGAAICMLLDRVIHGHERRRAMMLRPVKLHAARNPGSQQSNQRRLNNMLVIKKIVLISFIEAAMNPPTNLGEDHDLEVIILQVHRSILVVNFYTGDPVGKGVGIDLPAAALVNPFFQEHRIEIRRGGGISRDNDNVFPDFYGVWKSAAGH